MRGARSLRRDHLPLARAAVVGEPTDLQPMRMHKGIMMQGVKLRGQSGHSSDPSLGNNVIDALPTLLSVLSNYRDELATKFRCELMAVPVPTINFGCVHGGDSPNRICGELDFSFDVRMLPGLEYQDVERELNARLVEIAAHTTLISRCVVWSSQSRLLSRRPTASWCLPVSRLQAMPRTP